jgi:hypothetical protein
MKKYEWRYWFAGMKRPSKLPKGCRVFVAGKWFKETNAPIVWEGTLHRRWKVAIKTCKWTVHGANLIKNPHTQVSFVSMNMVCCNTCGKPVEIVKKGAK